MLALYQIEFDPDEEGVDHTFRVVIQSPDLKAVGGSTELYSFRAPYCEFAGPASLFVYCEVGVNFDTAGIYPTVLLIDEEPVNVFGLLVLRAV